MATIIDVALKANVSKSTVSLVINNSPLVKDETRRKVLEAIEALDYVPNNSARGLITKFVKSIGVVILTEDEHSGGYEFDTYPGIFSDDIITGVTKGLENTDYSIVMESFYARKPECGLPNIIKNRRIDGALIIGSSFCDEFVENVQKSGVPFLMLGVGRTDVKANSISADAVEGAYLAVKYLFSCGHRKVCYINCAVDYRSNSEHIEGVRKAVEESGVAFNWDWLVNCRNHSGLAGYEAFKSLWERGARPDGIAVANGTLALGIQRYLYEQNIRIPEDVSIIVYGDSMLCGYSFPALTAVNMQKEEMGRRAAVRILDMINGGGELICDVVEPYLVKRDSVSVILK